MNFGWKADLIVFLLIYNCRQLKTNLDLIYYQTVLSGLLRFQLIKSLPGQKNAKASAVHNKTVTGNMNKNQCIYLAYFILCKCGINKCKCNTKAVATHNHELQTQCVVLSPHTLIIKTSEELHIQKQNNENVQRVFVLCWALPLIYTNCSCL